MNTSSPKVSILMPCYNNALYLNEAIDSMLAQTFSDFELIVLDDCSTDNTSEVVAGYSDKRIVYHRNEQNMGLANNLNTGLDIAKGEYLARTDGDDISLPNRLQTQIDFLEQNRNIDFCSCGLQMFGQEDTVWLREENPENVKITMLFFSPLLHATSVWRKATFLQNNLRYNQETFPAEDYDLWSRAIFHCRMVNIRQVLYKYRIHGIQVTKTDDRNKAREVEIKTAFLHRALPTLSDREVADFIRFTTQPLTTLDDIKELRKVLNIIVAKNEDETFFEGRLLKKRMNKYHQAQVLHYIKTNRLSVKTLSLVVQLHPKLWLQIIR